MKLAQHQLPHIWEWDLFPPSFFIPVSGYSTFKERCPQRGTVNLYQACIRFCVDFIFKQPMLNSMVWGIVKQSSKCVGTFMIFFGFCTLHDFYPSSIWLKLFKIALLQAKSQVTSNLCPFGCVGDGAYGFSFKMCKLSVNWLSELNARQNVKSKRRKNGKKDDCFYYDYSHPQEKYRKKISILKTINPLPSA